MTNSDSTSDLTTMPSVSDAISLHYVGYTAVGELQMASISILQKPLLHLYSEFLKTGGCTARKARRLVFTDNGIRICQNNDDSTSEQFFHYALITYTNTVVLRTFKSHGKRTYGMFEPTLLGTYSIGDRTDTLFPLEKRFSKTDNIPIFPLLTMLHRPDPPNNKLHCHAFACMSVEQSHNVLSEIKAGVRLFFEDYETLAVDDNMFSTPVADFWKLTDDGWRMTQTKRTIAQNESENSEPEDVDEYRITDVKNEDLALFARASMASRVHSSNGELFTDRRVSKDETPEHNRLTSDSGVESPTTGKATMAGDARNERDNVPQEETSNGKPTKVERKGTKTDADQKQNEDASSQPVEITEKSMNEPQSECKVPGCKPIEVADESVIKQDEKHVPSPQDSPRSSRDKPKYIRGGVRVLPVSAEDYHSPFSNSGRRRPPVMPKPSKHKLKRQNAVQDSSPDKHREATDGPNNNTTKRQMSNREEDDDDEIWKIVQAYEAKAKPPPSEEWDWEEVGEQASGSPRASLPPKPEQKRPQLPENRCSNSRQGSTESPVKGPSLSRGGSSASTQSDRRPKSSSFEGPILLTKPQELIDEENRKKGGKSHQQKSKRDEIEHMLSDMSTSGLDEEEHSASMMNFEESLGYLP